MPDIQGNPGRIQRSRKRGFRTPEGTIYVGRPTMFGNPFQIARFGHKVAALHDIARNGGLVLSDGTRVDSTTTMVFVLILAAVAWTCMDAAVSK